MEGQLLSFRSTCDTTMLHLGCWDAHSAAGCISAQLRLARQRFWISTAQTHQTATDHLQLLLKDCHEKSKATLLRDPELRVSQPILFNRSSFWIFCHFVILYSELFLPCLVQPCSLIPCSVQLLVSSLRLYFLFWFWALIAPSKASLCWKPALGANFILSKLHLIQPSIFKSRESLAISS